MMKDLDLFPKRIFGLRTDIVGNVHFNNDDNLIYPAAGVLVLHDCVTSTQKYLRFDVNSQPKVIVVSPNRQLLAVSEVNVKTQKTQVNIYDLDGLEKLKTLKLPAECPVQAVGSLCFTRNSKGIAVLSKEPNAFVTIYSLDKNDWVVTGRASNKDYAGHSSFLQCHPKDNLVVAVGNENMLKIMQRTDKSFVQLAVARGDNVVFTCLAWLTPEVVVVGSTEMELCFFESCQLKAKYNMMNREVIDLGKPHDFDATKPRPCTLGKQKAFPIECLIVFPNGFAFATNNKVHVFEKESASRFKKKTLLTIVPKLYEDSLYVIKNIAINEQQDTIVATTQHSQIYIGQLVSPETVTLTKLNFALFSEPLHVDSIVDLSVCSWKNIVMTASKDRTIRVWNYQTMKVEMVKKFHADVNVVALHPSGMFAALGFKEVVRLVRVQLEDLKTTKSFNLPMCCTLKFSHKGHLLAVGCLKEIAIISVFTFKTILSLEGHNGVQSVAWSADDSFLVSTGQEGSVIRWNLSSSGERIDEFHQNETIFNSVAFSPDRDSVLGATRSAHIKEIRHSQMVQELRAPDGDSQLTALAMANSNQILFTANDRGCLYYTKWLPDVSSSFSSSHFHDKAITGLCISADEQVLITAGEGGTLIIWEISSLTGASVVDRDLGSYDDILISRRELTSKVNQIELLETRLHDQEAEYRQRKQQGESFFTDHMDDINQKCQKDLDDVRHHNEEIDEFHIKRMSELKLAQIEIEKNDQLEIDELRTKLSAKLAVEQGITKALEEKMEKMKKNYEEIMKKSESCLQETTESLKKSYKVKLAEQDDYTNRLELELNDKKTKFKENHRQSDDDHDRDMVKSHVAFQQKLKEKEETIDRWRGDVGDLKNKNRNIEQKRKNLSEDLEDLKSKRNLAKATIVQTQKQIDDLKEKLTQKIKRIEDKEKQLSELKARNLELEKYKRGLTLRNDDLKSAIEPDEKESRYQKQRLFERENETKLVKQNLLNEGVKLTEMRGKFLGSQKELNVQRDRANVARDQLKRICSEIHDLESFVEQPEKLKNEMIALFHRYGSEAELKKTLELDIEVQDKFALQREIYENSVKVAETSSRTEMNQDAQKFVKLLRENATLLAERNRLFMDLSGKNNLHNKLKSLLGSSSHTLNPIVARRKLENAISERDVIHEKNQDKIEKLEEQIKILIEENQNLRSQSN